MKLACQIVLLLIVAYVLLVGLYQDTNGLNGKRPFGFIGAVVTIAITALLFLIFLGAGAFSEVFK